MKILDIMMHQCENMEDTIKRGSKILQHLPLGSLSAYSKNDHVYYSKYNDHQVSYLRIDDPEIDQLKARHLTELVLDSAKYDLDLMYKTIQQFRTYDPNELLATFAKAYQGVSAKTVNALGFAYTFGYADDPQLSTKHPEHLKYVTSRGTKRRSKSELIIDGIYEMLKIPVLYERPLVMLDGTVVNPDYTAWSELIRLYKYHDHVGMVADPERMKMNYWKFERYIEMGIYPFDRLLYTFDKPDGSIDAEEITMLIRMFMQ